MNAHLYLRCLVHFHCIAVVNFLPQVAVLPLDDVVVVRLPVLVEDVLLHVLVVSLDFVLVIFKELIVYKIKISFIC